MAEANAASVALLDRDRVLLIKRAFEPLKGRWTLPGGRREPGETIEETAIREVREELGLSVYGLRPVMLLPVGKYLLKVFATQGFEGEVRASAEVEAHDWRTPQQLAALSTTPGLDEVIERAFALFDRR